MNFSTGSYSSAVIVACWLKRGGKSQRGFVGCADTFCWRTVAPPTD